LEFSPRDAFSDDICGAPRLTERQHSGGPLGAAGGLLIGGLLELRKGLLELGSQCFLREPQALNLPPAAEPPPLGAAAEATVEAPVVEEKLANLVLCRSRPSFAGDWLLQRADGDFDTFLSDVGMSWLNRKAAMALNYGVGRVRITCEQPCEDDFTFLKLLADPRKSEARSCFHVGAGSFPVSDDIGTLIANASWEGEVLHFAARIDASGLPLTMLMYLNGDGALVEEMISSKGTSVKYVFAAQI